MLWPHLRRPLAALACLLLPVCAAAEEWTPIPDGGQSLLPSPVTMRLSGSAQLAGAETVAVSNMPFDTAYRVTVKGKPAQAWDVQAMARTQGDFRSGDVLLFSLFVRGTAPGNESGEAYGIAYMQKSTSNYDKIVGIPFSAGAEWRQLVLPVKVGTTLGAGQHEVTIFLGYFEQTVEIGGLALVNYRTTRTVAELPRTRIRYDGADENAPWRREAAETIEQIRKADITVTVRDGSGNPVREAEVRVRQTRHEFGFGSAVAADGIFSSGQDGDRYRAVIREWFNKVVLENDLKWPGWESNRGKALNALAWLRDNAVGRVRGHTLVWPGWSRMPSDVQKLAGDPAALRARVLDHITDELTATRGQLVEWDVINEPYTNTDLQKILGDQEMAEWFRKAREIEPWAVLYINDYSILTNGGNDKAHQDHYYSTIGKLIEWGAPVSGIGMQGHFGAQLTSPARVWQILDRFSKFGAQIHITEFDIDVDDEEVQGAYTRDFLTTIFAHPSVSGFMMWGFWEGRHWKPKAAMFRRDWSIKPNGQAFYDLVFREWWTDASGRTGPAGSFAVRGFKGDYEIEVAAGGKTYKVPATADWRGAAVTVTLE